MRYISESDIETGAAPFREEDAPLFSGCVAFVEGLVKQISCQSVVAIQGRLPWR